MNHAFLKRGFAAELGLLVISGAAPVALADPPGSYFQDFDRHLSPSASNIGPRTATDAQIEAINQKTDQALARAQQVLREAQQAATAQQALREAQQATQKHAR